jgi:CheY-like chemotaxis protein
VVEDEAVIACLLADVLSLGGYRVTTCATVGAALEALATGDEFALCVSDFLLPDRTGLELARELRKLRPQVRMVLASAFLETEVEELVANEPSVALVVRKPVDVFALRAQIDALVQPRGGARFLATPERSVEGLEG